jgi:hypothetical protein
MTSRKMLPLPNSWRNLVPLAAASVVGTITLIALSPVFLLVWLCSLGDRLRKALSSRKTLTPRHEVSLP